MRSPVRRITADRIKLRIPVLGPIVQKNAVVEMSRTLGLLLRSGLSMMATLDLTRNGSRATSPFAPQTLNNGQDEQSGFLTVQIVCPSSINASPATSVPLTSAACVRNA